MVEFNANFKALWTLRPTGTLFSVSSAEAAAR